MSAQPIRRALLSLSDKTAILEFAQALSQWGIELLATRGTAHLLLAAGIRVVEISDYTHFPEMMAGRIKTLHPKIQGGILGRRGQDDLIMTQYGMLPIDMVVVNLYPFAQTVATSHVSMAEVMENIDIGGPAMVRAAAKNYHHVAIVVKSSDYPAIITELEQQQGRLSESTRLHLACKAFEYTAAYDAAIANYFGSLVPAYYGDTQQPAGPFPRTLNLNYIKKQEMRYGENPHQPAALYLDQAAKEGSVALATQLQGKALSYNNIADADTALECVKTLCVPACVIVKHANPCGAAGGDTLIQSYQRAYQADPTAAFGGIIACNTTLDAETVECIINQQFVELIIAPNITAAALTLLTTKPNVRVVACGNWQPHITALDFKRVNGGLLVQQDDLAVLPLSDLRVVSAKQPTGQELKDALFSWRVVKFVKSNAIVYARDGMTLAIGAGQMSRVDATKIAAIKAQKHGLSLKGAAMASDAFFPFRDSIDAAAVMGVSSIIQPGGSIHDDKIIAAADEHNIAMIFTGVRHLRH